MDSDFTQIRNRQDLNPDRRISHLKALTNSITNGFFFTNGGYQKTVLNLKTKITNLVEKKYALTRIQGLIVCTTKGSILGSILWPLRLQIDEQEEDEGVLSAEVCRFLTTAHVLGNEFSRHASNSSK